MIRTRLLALGLLSFGVAAFLLNSRDFIRLGAEESLAQELTSSVGQEGARTMHKFSTAATKSSGVLHRPCCLPRVARTSGMWEAPQVPNNSNL